MMAVFLLLASLLCVAGKAHSAPHSAWNFIKDLDQQEALAFKQIVSPLVEMSANAYTHSRLQNIFGWSLATKLSPLAPPHGGAHALVYLHDFSERMVVAFRGTATFTSQDGVADLCADQNMFGQGFPGIPSVASRICSMFAHETLDYYSQAVKYTKQAVAAYPARSLLLTGHSLGAGLALLVSANFSDRLVLPVVGFGAPGVSELFKRWNLELKAVYKHMVFVIGDEWDVIMRYAWNRQVGIICLYQTQETHHCSACLQNAISRLKVLDLPRSSKDLDCLACFFESHSLKHMISLVYQGSRPVCQTANFNSAYASGWLHNLVLHMGGLLMNAMHDDAL